MAEITQIRCEPRCLTGQGFQALKEVQVRRFKEVCGKKIGIPRKLLLDIRQDKGLNRGR